MKRELLMALALTFICAACDGDADPRMPTSSSEAGELGSINLSLIGTDSKGTQYRLRGAELLIAKESTSGIDAGTTPLTTLSTELDPDAAYLSARLAPGIYQVTLLGAWYIERIGPTGAERVERAALLGDATQRTHVTGGGSAALVFYRFGIDGDVIDFDTGELRIGVDFQQPRDSGVDAGAGDMDAGEEPGADAGEEPGADAGEEPGDDAGEEPGADAGEPASDVL
jgi:hypothetical protein